MRKIRKIIVHCSDSKFGDSALIKEWHTKERGWDDIGYHYVILNSHPVDVQHTIDSLDGLVEVGRPVEIQGAHTISQNRDSIGICVIGISMFTLKQRESLTATLASLCTQYSLHPQSGVFGHSEYSNKSCPNMDMHRLRNRVCKYMGLPEQRS